MSLHIGACLFCWLSSWKDKRGVAHCSQKEAMRYMDRARLPQPKPGDSQQMPSQGPWTPALFHTHDQALQRSMECLASPLLT